MSQEEVIARTEAIAPSHLDEEHDANALALIYQNLAEIVKKNLLGPEALLDHIAGRPPGECRAVAE